MVGGQAAMRILGGRGPDEEGEEVGELEGRGERGSQETSERCFTMKRIMGPECGAQIGISERETAGASSPHLCRLVASDRKHQRSRQCPLSRPSNSQPAAPSGISTLPAPSVLERPNQHATYMRAGSIAFSSPGGSGAFFSRQRYLLAMRSFIFRIASCIVSRPSSRPSPSYVLSKKGGGGNKEYSLVRTSSSLHCSHRSLSLLSSSVS